MAHSIGLMEASLKKGTVYRFVVGAVGLVVKGKPVRE